MKAKVINLGISDRTSNLAFSSISDDTLEHYSRDTTEPSVAWHSRVQTSSSMFPEIEWTLPLPNPAVIAWCGVWARIDWQFDIQSG